MAASLRLAGGTTFASDFQIEKSLFEGENRAVYLAEQKSTGRKVALKVLSAELLPDEAARKLFLDEAKAGGKVHSVHVLDVRGVGVDAASGLPWVAAEVLEGENLNQKLKREGKTPASDWDELLSQVLHGLSSVHQARACHGALNGESVFLARPAEVDEAFRVELLDFGMPRLARMKNVSELERSLWAAPEVLAGGEPTPASDVWSVAHLAYRVLSGRSYFKSQDVASLKREVAAGCTEAASARARSQGAGEGLPPSFDAWFARCTRLEPAQRFADAHQALEGAADLLSEASGVAGEVIESDDAPRQKAKPPPLPPMVRVIAENPKPAIAVILLLVVVALGGGFSLGLLRGGEKKGAEAARAAAITWSKGSFEPCKKACDDGDPSACHGLGQMHQYGLKVPKDEALAAQLFELACSKGDPSACTSAAQISLSGSGVRKRPEQAAEFYKKACDGGDAVGCADLADMYTAGNGVPKNEATAAELRGKACKAGMTEFCK